MTRKTIIGEDEISNLSKEEHEFLQAGTRRDKDFKPRGYDSLLLSLTKGKAFDSLSTKYKELQKENESLKKKLRGELPPVRGKDEKDKPGDKKEISLKDVGDPAGFLSGR
jgi:hypothetical protein